MRFLIVFTALVLAYQARAQGTEIIVQEENIAPVEESAAPQAPAAAPAQSAGNPIYILNNQRNSPQSASANQNAVQEQPATVVQDTPLKVSPAEQMRKHRQDSEAQTEDGIVQALEKARIQDEMSRRDKFNNAIAPVVTPAPAAQPQALAPQPAPVQVVVPAPVAAPKQKILIAEDRDEDDEDVIVTRPAKKTKKDFKEVSDDEDKVDIRSEIRSAIAESSVKKEDSNTYYISALANFGTYNNVRNVDNSMGYGFAVGTVTPEHWVAEGSFAYGNYHLQNLYGTDYSTGGYGNNGGYSPLVVNMAQYNVEAAAKYQLLPGKFKPALGAVISYTRRQYSYQGGDAFSTTDAIDAGAVVGADLQIGSGFSIGVDFRYMTNLGSRSNAQNQNYVLNSGTSSPEKLDYYTIGLIAKFLF